MTPQDVLALIGGGALAGVATWFRSTGWPKVQAWRDARRSELERAFDNGAG
jgi:hypothetical protein